MTRLESALHTLSHDPQPEPAPGNLADRALNRARQRTRRRGVLGVAATAVVAALVAVGVTTTATSAQQKRTAPGPAATTSAVTGPRVNVLLIGSDGAPDRIGVRPDTIVVASIDTASGDTTLFGLPRSLQRVPFPAGTAAARAWPDGFYCPGSECLLNAIWFWAERDGKQYYPGDRNPGLAATRQAAEGITGLSIDDTVVINMQGLVTLVDSIGGVDVNVTERLPMGGNARDQAARHGWLEAGRQHLAGNEALWYARSRWSTSDYDRMYRQQCLISALTEQIEPVALVRSFPKLAKALKQNLSTSISADELGDWAELAAKMKDAEIQRVGLSTNTADPDYPAIRKQVAKMLPGGRADGPAKKAAGKAGADLEHGWVSSGSC